MKGTAMDKFKRALLVNGFSVLVALPGCAVQAARSGIN